MRSSRGNEPTVIAKSDDLQSRKRGQSVEVFSFNLKKKVPRYYRGIFNLKVPLPVPRY